MKRNLFIGAFVIILIIVICTINFTAVQKHVVSTFWSFVCTALDNDEKERQERINNGELVYGKDTALIWGNMFEISHVNKDYVLAIEKSDLSDEIIRKIYTYKAKGDNLYILSDEGYAVIDSNNFCRVYITVPENKFISGYTTDEDGKKVYISRKIECENVKYLSSFGEFDEKEQEYFNKLEKKVNK